MKVLLVKDLLEDANGNPIEGKWFHISFWYATFCKFNDPGIKRYRGNIVISKEKVRDMYQNLRKEKIRTRRQDA